MVMRLAPARRRTVVIVILALAITTAIAYGLVTHRQHAPSFAHYEVTRGEFLDVLQFRGEMKAMSSLTIAAPADGGDLQIIKIATDGSQVKKGDVVVEFDSSKNRQTLAQDQSILKSSQAEIEAVRATARLTEEQDATAIMKARFDFESARLDASKGEILSHIAGAEADLKVADAQQAWKEAEQKLKSDQAADHATVDDKTFGSKKADYDATRAAHALQGMTLLAPTDGTISLIPVWHDGSEKAFKAGERVWPGAPIAELPDASSLQINARVDETERGRIALKQPVNAQLDALADKQFTGHIVQISTIATSDFSAGWPIPRNFNLQIGLDLPDPQMRPGMAVQVTVIVNRVPNSIVIPAQASFQDSGQTVAYVWDGHVFQKRPIQIDRRSRDRILVSRGLQAGDLVALTDPSAKD